MMAMPLYMNDLFGYPTAMALAIVLGIAFGFVLERAGFGRATVLAAQFYGNDMRVFKVMFTAIATATAGLGLLAGMGQLDLALLKVPETFLWPHLVGGLLLGVGFIVSGYCPGTAMVATASGRMDGLYSLLGVMVGALAYAGVWPWIEGFHNSGAMGVVQLTHVFGLSWQVIAVGVVAMAVAAFIGAEAVERWLARRGGELAFGHAAPPRNRVFAGLAGLALVAVAAGLVPPAESEAATEAAVVTISPMELAERLIAAPQSVYLVDLRDPAACEKRRLAGALCLSVGDPEAGFAATLPSTRVLVVYGEGDLQALPAAVSAFAGQVVAVAGGWAAIEDRLLTQPELAPGAPVEAVARWKRRSAVVAHFTGAKPVAVARPVKVKMVRRAVKKGGGC